MFPQKWIGVDSPLNKSCFPKPWKQFFVLSWFTGHSNISIRMVSKKLSVNVKLEKLIVLTQSHFPMHFLPSIFFSFPFFKIYRHFFFLHRFRLSIFFEWKTQQELKEGATTPYRCSQIVDFTKFFFKCILHTASVCYKIS